MSSGKRRKEYVLLESIRSGRPMSWRQRLELIVRLSVPSMLAQLSSIVMLYIDASMVGSLGAEASASIGLVSTTTWLFNGVCAAAATAFSICRRPLAQHYLTETITMQMGNRMEKNPDVRYYPIEDNAPLSDYVTIDETTEFEIDEEGNPVILFPAGTVTDEAHGEQSFRIPKLYS